MQVLGGNGYINDYPTGRLLRDAKVWALHVVLGHVCVSGVGGVGLGWARGDATWLTGNREGQPNLGSLGRGVVGLVAVRCQ